MDIFSQANKLDAVLAYMANNGKPEFETSAEIAKGLKYQERESTELHLILNKLIKDGFVEFKETKRLLEIPGRKREKISEYIITFEGLYHQQSGGYHQQEKKDHAESVRLDTAIAYQRGQADTLNRLTRLVAWGTVAASGIAFLLLVWEIRHVLLKVSHHLFD